MSAGKGRWVVGGLGVLGFLYGAYLATSARGDVIELRGGGQIQGKVVPDPKDKGKVQILLMQGRHPLTFQKDRIARVVPKASPLDDYVVKRAKVAATAESQYQLGYWCEQNRLTDLAKQHFQQALVYDPDFEEAHLKLGHTKVEGSWLNRDELSAAQGLVKYKGRWVTAEEKTKREDADKITAAQGSWLRRLRILRQAIVTGSAERKREAESQLMAIRDVDAVVPLMRVFARDEAPRRILLAMVLATIKGSEATAALVQRVLDEPDAEVRSITLDHLKRRNDSKASARLVRALGTENVQVINRAAWALGNLNAVDSVPSLVGVLVTSEDQIVVPDLSAGGGGLPGPTIPVTPGLTPRAYSNFGVIASGPPVVGPGVVAYGIGVVPYYGLSPGAVPGGVGAMPSKPPQDAHVETFTYRNVEVLNALQKLTGQDFGYDIEAWRAWITRSFNPHPIPRRRVPQP